MRCSAMAGGESIFDMFLLLIMCCLAMSFLRRPRSSATEEERIKTDVWFVSYEINKAFDTLNDETKSWEQKEKEQEEEKKPSRLVSVFVKRKEEERFVIEEAISPRLINVADPREGKITFELIEAEEGGTLIEVSYSQKASGRIQTLKAQLPIKVPLQNVCKSCGRPVLLDFTVCPYCGKKLS